MRRFIRNGLLLINILFALALLSTYLVPVISPKKLWIFPFLGLFQLYFFLINSAFLVFWLVVKWRFSFISMFCLLIGFNNIGHFIRYTPRKIQPQAGIKVLTYNVHSFYSYFESKKRDVGILEFIASQKADIICLQETKLQKSGELNPIRLKSRFPGINHCQLAHMSPWGGPVTFSRFPIINMGEIRFSASTNMAIFTDIKYNDDTLRVYNCHLQSFSILKKEYSIVDSLSFESQKLKEAKTIGGKLKRGNSKRSDQIKILAEHIKQCPYKQIIVCGDFNDIPNSYTYSKIDQLLEDAYIGSGSGTSNTFRFPIAPFRIDYVFHSRQFKSYNYTCHKVGYSDHYPVSAVLVPTGNKK